MGAFESGGRARKENAAGKLFRSEAGALYEGVPSGKRGGKVDRVVDCYDAKGELKGKHDGVFGVCRCHEASRSTGQRRLNRPRTQGKSDGCIASASQSTDIVRLEDVKGGFPNVGVGER